MAGNVERCKTRVGVLKISRHPGVGPRPQHVHVFRQILEAAAMGLPLVTTRNPGCESVVDEGRNGFLVEAGNAEALTKRIGELVRQPMLRRRFSEQSREIAVKRFDLSVVVDATARHYRRLLEAAGRPALPGDDAGTTVGAGAAGRGGSPDMLDTGTTGPVSNSE